MIAKEIIKSRGFTVKQLADKLGKNYQGLNNGLNNNLISLTGLREIADAIGCKVGDFFADETSSPSATTHPATLTCPHCGGKISIEAKPLHDSHCK